jgi:selenocysteine-specific elongation factor
MKSVIVGTAGHIDHGKTALVRALTGIDTDRLEEEKRRGITIDLGFAHLQLNTPQGDLRLGFVDVPGHERFVRNMLAGVGGMDLVLLVISAEDSIKLQTREHFDICRLLRIPRGITVITKCDLVDAETRQLVRIEAEEFVRDSFLDAACSPIVEVSVRTGEGLDQLKQELSRIALEVTQKDAASPFRLPIDRVFTMKGFGTVITGTLISGQLHKEDEIEILPSRMRARVRGVQVHGSSTESASAGQRTAVNLAGVPQEELQRGMFLAAPNLLLPTHRLDVQLSVLAGAPPLKNHSLVHLHLFSAETTARVVLHQGEELRAGETAWAQLRTAAPIVSLPGDRFIIRRISPVTTIGGGLVADVRPMRKMKPEARVAMLEALGKASPSERLTLLVSRREQHGLSLQSAVHETGWPMQTLRNLATDCAAKQQLASFGDILIATPTLRAITAALLHSVELFQKSSPLAGGMSKQELLEKSALEKDIFTGALNSLLAEKKLELTGEHVHLPGRRLVMQDDELETKRRIEAVFATAGLKVPALKEALAQVKIDQSRAQKIVTLLLREKVLVKLSDDLVFHQQTLDELKKLVVACKSKSPTIDVARFKDLTGVSRKYAIPLLEYLDREHITRRAADARIIL